MKNLLEDIEDIKHNSGIEDPKILFKVKSYSQLVQILEELRNINYCSNYDAWMRNSDKIKDIFDNQYSDCIELNVQQRSATYSTRSKIKEESGKKSKLVLISSDYFKKMPRKKLTL